MATTNEVTTGGETVTGGGTTTSTTLYDATGYPSGLVTTTTPGATGFVPVTKDETIYSPTPIATNDEQVWQGFKVEVTGIGNVTQDDEIKTETAQQTNAASTTQKSKPGRRTFNPLAAFSSYTYHITLYMITPYTYNKFIEQGNAGITPEGMYIVAESGGTNVNGKNQRLFGDFDYYIDDFNFQTYLSTNANKGANVDSLSFNFKIYEPYGFSFMSRLKAAAGKVVAQSELPGHQKAGHHLQQRYMIGIKFYGYDAEGNLVTNDTTNQLTPNNVNGTNTAQYADNGVFARYFPVQITAMQFRLDGRTTVYDFKAINVSMNAGTSSKNNVIPTKQSIVGKTVEELLATGENSLEKLLNQLQENYKKDGKISAKNVYKIKFNRDNSKIKSSTVTLGDAADRDKSPVAGSGKIADSSQSNDKNAQKVKPDNNARTFEIPAGQPITKVIETVIGQSSYIRDALTMQGKEDMSDWSDEAKAAEKTRLQWFIITPVCKMLEFDTVIKDFAYEITYLINEYKVPRVRSVYISDPEKFYGSHKIYNYYFTGENSEVLSYEQKYNGLFYLNALDNPNPGKSYENSDPLPAAIAVDRKQPADDSGLFDKAGQMIASVRTSLYSPGEQAMATIHIMGDPDFICTTIGMNYGVYDEYYGPDDSIDPHVGQVFMQLILNEARDYNHNTGLMDINRDVRLYNYPSYLANEKGIIYTVSDVVSTFSKGKFTQELHLVLYSPPADKVDSDKAENAREVSSLASRYPAPKGFTPDVASSSDAPTTEQASQTESTYTGNLSDTNNSIVSKLTGGRVQVASETSYSSINPTSVVQGTDDDNSGVKVTSNIQNEGRPFVMYGVRG